MQEQVTLCCPSEWIASAKRFLESYDSKEATTCPSEKMKDLTARTERVCRFCGRRQPEVSFRIDAHIFPQQLGNRYLLSDFECDSCNVLFGRYETDMANFLGPVRYLQGIQGKTKSHFTAPDKKIRVVQAPVFGIPDAISVSRDDFADNSIEVDHESGRGTLRFTKHSYTPIKVYKAFLKMALSCLNKEDIKKYDLAIQYLLTDRLDKAVNGITNVFAFQLPMSFGHREPFAMLYEKINPKEELPTHVFILYFANIIFQIVLPLHKDDLRFYNGKNLGLRVCPPFFGDPLYAETVTIQERVFDLSSTQPVRGEQEVFHFQMDKEAMKDAVVYNPATGQSTADTSQFKELAKLVMVRRGLEIDLPLSDTNDI